MPAKKTKTKKPVTKKTKTTKKKVVSFSAKRKPIPKKNTKTVWFSIYFMEMKKPD